MRSNFNGGFPKINAVEWRKGEEPMQIVSWIWGKGTVHYEAHPSNRMPDEIYKILIKTKFFDCFKKETILPQKIMNKK